MDKPQLIKRIAEMHPQLKTKEAEYAVKVILDAFCGTLAKGGRVEIRGFGSFSLKQLPQKQKRNHQTGLKLKEPPRYIPYFKPAKELLVRACEGNGTEITEVYRLVSTSPDQLDREVANDIEHTATYG